MLAGPAVEYQGKLNVAARVARTEAEGPGTRYALWVQGCPLRCVGCCNPHMLEDREESIIETQAIIDEILATDGIEGVTLIGGEPFWQSRELAQLATAVRAADLGVMVFTGLTIELLKRRAHPHDLAFLDQIDLLIDGPYVQSKRDLSRRWIGSSNQRAHFLTPRYQYLQDEVWGRGSKNTVELRMVGSQITINGWPDLDVVALSEASIKPVKKAGEP